MLINIETEYHYDGESVINIDCYSYQSNEFISVLNVLNDSGVIYQEMHLKKDKNDRIGLRYSIRLTQITILEKFLSFSFFSDEKNGEGASYKCEQIDVYGTGNECKNIQAESDDAAKMICAIVAKKSRWFGGVARRGNCR